MPGISVRTIRYKLTVLPTCSNKKEGGIPYTAYRAQRTPPLLTFSFVFSRFYTYFRLGLPRRIRKVI